MAFISTVMYLFLFTVIVMAMLVLVLFAGSGSLDALKERFIPDAISTIANERIQNFKSLNEKIAEEKSLIRASKYKIGEVQHLLQDPVMLGTSASDLKKPTEALKSALIKAELEYSKLCDRINGISSKHLEFQEADEYNKEMIEEIDATFCEEQKSHVTTKIQYGLEPICEKCQQFNLNDSPTGITRRSGKY